MLLCYALNVKLNCANYTTIFIHIYYKRGVLLVEAGGGPFLGPHHGNSICQQCHRSKNIGRSHTFLKPILSNDSTQNSNNISDFFLHNNDSCPKLMFFLPYFFNYFTCPPYKTNEINFGFGPACNDHYFRKGRLFY